MSLEWKPRTVGLFAIDASLFVVSCIVLYAYILHRLLWLQSLNADYLGAAFDISALTLAVVALLCLAWNRSIQPHYLFTCCAGALLGLIFFVSTLGFALVSPTNIGWLMRQDWALHFIGWAFYRNAPWMWPPGAFDTFWYPVGTAIVYTDSLPLVAMLLKPFSSLLAPRFQYIGFWLMLNCILQGVFAAVLIRCFTNRLALQMLGAGLILLAPVFISRIGHDTLTTQWLLLAGLWMYFRRGNNPTHAMQLWVAFAAIAALVHPYLSAMLLALAFAYYLRETVAKKNLGMARASRHFAFVIGVTVFCWYLSGVFTLHPSGGDVALGVYNANLLTWFDSQFLSRWIPPLPHAGDGQYEGVGYLGLGILLLMPIAALFTLIQKNAKLTPEPWWPLLIVVAALTLFAISTRVTFGSHVLFDITPTHPLLVGAFRGSGRFIWPSVYLISLISVVVIVIKAGRLAAPLLALAFFVQLLDLSPLHVRDAQMRLANFTVSPVLLHDSYWELAATGRSHITLVPPPACGKEAAPYLPFSMLASDHKMTINTGYLARFDEEKTFAYCDVFRGQIDRGERSADTLYIVSSEMEEHFRATSTIPPDCRHVEGYIACTVAGPETKPTERMNTSP